MIDILLPLRKSYFTILTSIGLKVYEESSVPDKALTPYVIISTQTAIEDSNKSDFGHNATVLLDIVTSYAINNIGGTKQADEIAQQILNVINSKTYFPINPALQNVGLKIGDTHKMNSVTLTERVYRRLIRFEHIVRQVN